MVNLPQPQLMSVQRLFESRLFEIPGYQRAYAWEQKQCGDLWQDIREGLGTNTSHFLGTVVLMSQGERHYDREGRSLRVFQLVDGQQRATTLCLLLLAVFDRLQQYPEPIAQGLWKDFIEHEKGLRKLHLGKLNAKYFGKLVAAVQSNQEPPTDQRLTNARLRNAFRQFERLIGNWLKVEHEQGHMTALSNLVSYVRDELHVLCFFTNSRRLAIKTFQTVNDRGKKLSLLDKTKSFLMFYITRYLKDDEKIFLVIEEKFGQVFDNYDAVKDLASKLNVNYLSSPRFRFNEDEFLRYAYHYGTKDHRSRFELPYSYGYEYEITPEQVFDRFVKGVCRHLRKRPAVLGKFIVNLCKDLDAVSRALVDLLELVRQDPSYEQLFRFQEPNASVYPLLVGAKARDFLDREMLSAIAILDLRVYQIRGTDPKADLYRHAVSKMKTGERNDIYKYIVQYCHYFGSDQALDGILRGSVYGRSFTKFVLWECAVESETGTVDHDLFRQCQVDHILPDDPSTFDVTTVGFDSNEDYEASKHRFGNLTVLESRLNKRARNRSLGDKARIYGESDLRSNQVLGARIDEDGFPRKTQAGRLDELVEFFKRKWPIPGDRN